MPYSKSEVNRAGQVLANRLHLAIERETIDEQHQSEILEAMEVIEWWRGEHARPLSRVAANLRYYAGEQGKPIVAQRLKKLLTIADKLLREPTMKLSQMADIGGVRAVLPDQATAYKVASRLRKNWTITRFRDYVAEPKPDGYRALHLINRNRRRLIEVQLRTPHQDFWANSVETFSRLAPGLKFGGGPSELRDYFKVLGAVLSIDDQGLRVDPALLTRAKELNAQASTFVERAR